jgi:ABC-type cobalamin/Fe3+-siderophores transport system ATPase subunit
MLEYSKYKRGSEWRNWDLHFHTPSSHDYENKSITNQEIIDGLKSNNISVVAITDHHVIDVERIRDLQAIGGDEITILPGIEFCSELGGSESIHFIGIFPEKSDIESIWTTIQGTVGLTKQDIESKGGFDNIQCDLIETCDLIHKLGGITTVHAGTKTNTVESIKNTILNKMQQKRRILSDSIDILELGKVIDENDYREIVFKSIGFILPMIICSDNHNINSYNLKENLWIKADPTFEGLKQITFEPTERVKLQAAKPEEKTGYHVIDSVSINEGEFWQNEIFLNPNLNTIIGGRSTGKSTLLKCIAKKIDPSIKLLTEKEEIFINNHINGISLKWKDGESNLNRDIQFFPQSYMYEIATSVAKTNEIIETIIKENDTDKNLSKYDSFNSSNRTEIINKLNNLFQLQTEIDNYKNELKEKGDKSGITKEIKSLEDKIKAINSGSAISKEDLTAYEELIKLISQREQSIKLANEDLTIIKKLQVYTVFNTSLEYEFNGLSDTTRETVKKIFEQLKIETDIKWVNQLTSQNDALLKQISIWNSEIKTAKESDIYQKGEKNLINNKQYQEYKEKLEEERKKLNIITEIEKNIAKVQEQLNKLKEVIVNLHFQYYTKVRELITQLTLSYNGIEIRANFYILDKKLKEFFDARLNQRSGERQRYIVDFIDNYSSNVKSYISDFLNRALRNEIEYKGGHINNNVTSELLSTNWFGLTYDLTYQNDIFIDMSQGKQAFVILKLLLEFSNKSCPILIDQPEDSLDNRAIYNELVKYLKDKKKERQIILVTHNPNVVVSADAEQIIVANQDGKDSPNEANIKFQYVSGALEFSKPEDKSLKFVLKSKGIREHVCEILEGGEDAFKQRERKYAIK